MGIEKLQPITAGDALFSGEAKDLTFTIYDEDDQVQDITGWTIEWRLYSHNGGESAILEKAGALTDPENGVVTVNLTADDTSLEPNTYYHELWRDEVGFEAVMAYGAVVLQ